MNLFSSCRLAGGHRCRSYPTGCSVVLLLAGGQPHWPFSGHGQATVSGQPEGHTFRMCCSSNRLWQVAPLGTHSANARRSIWSRIHFRAVQGDNVISHGSFPSDAIQEVAGTIHRVDTASREIVLLVHGELTQLIVPPDCSIRLNGEKVKLRLLQPGDQAEVSYSQVRNAPFAHSIQVNWLPRAAAVAKARQSNQSVVTSAPGRLDSKEDLP